MCVCVCVYAACPPARHQLAKAQHVCGRLRLSSLCVQNEKHDRVHQSQRTRRSTTAIQLKTKKKKDFRVTLILPKDNGAATVPGGPTLTEEGKNRIMLDTRSDDKNNRHHFIFDGVQGFTKDAQVGVVVVWVWQSVPLHFGTCVDCACARVRPCLMANI